MNLNQFVLGVFIAFLSITVFFSNTEVLRTFDATDAIWTGSVFFLSLVGSFIYRINEARGPKKTKRMRSIGLFFVFGPLILLGLMHGRNHGVLLGVISTTYASGIFLIFDAFVQGYFPKWTDSDS